MLVFILLTVVIFGGVAFLMGQAIAETWRPAWQNIPYGILLTLANRFFAGSLFQQSYLSLVGFAVDVVVLIAIALVAYRLTQARKMVAQYPWIYERAGLFSWREKTATQG
jgi:branched-chain amino acid transport system ATP-binding protein